MAEGVRFELTRPFGLPVFKTGAFNRSATPPEDYGRENCATGAAVSKDARLAAVQCFFSIRFDDESPNENRAENTQYRRTNGVG